MSEFETLLVEDRGPARVITVNRPKVLNALNATVIAELDRAIAEVATASAAGVRGVVITGAGGKAFVAGADIAAMADMSPEAASAFASAGHGVGEKIARLDVPVIAAVDGFALGGGCELALACDWIYATAGSRFGQPEVKLGVIPGFGGTQRMLRRVGLARALELCTTGAMIGAEEALRIGLVNRVVPTGEDVVAAAVATVDLIAKMGPRAVASAKALIHRGQDLTLGEANCKEVEGFAALFETPEQREGMAAFIGKRDANFPGRSPG